MLANKIFFSVLLFLFPVFAYAYIGPGAGISTIGSAIVFVVIVFLLIVGFLWYPLKKIFGKKKTPETSSDAESDKSQGL